MCAALLLIYGLTLAPGLTLWDSGEFLSAIATLGVPHPPGTPLFVVTGRAWSEALGFLPLAVAMNLASAVATAVACAALAGLFLGWAGRGSVLAGGLVAGTMGAVWQSATETEVYAMALCLGVLSLVVADVAGRRGSARHRLLVAYLFGLAVSLQISALVAGPAAVLLLSTDDRGAWSWRAALAPAGAWTVAVGLGTASLGIGAAGTAVLAVAALVPPRPGASRRVEPVLAAACVLIGASFVLVMLVRAQHDPGVNQGNPSSWGALWDVIARQQYDVPGLWPRRAPWWLQIGNLIQYADWQVAAGLSDVPGPSLLRTPFTVVMAVAAVYGAAWHRRGDPRSFRVFVCLLLAATLGVIAVLNLRAGPSYGWGVLPDGAMREARERDYFFALAFALCGLWAGLGVVRLALGARGTRWRHLILGVAALPVVLNWQANDRRRLPDAVLASSLGHALLLSAPPDAVLVTAGDNDSYASWFTQYVEGYRPDVATVVSPLLGARWYREELRRRHALLDSAVAAHWHGEEPTLAAIAAAARRHHRPLMVSSSLERSRRSAMGSAWKFGGLGYVNADSGQPPGAIVDTAVAQTVAEWLRGRGLGAETRAARGSTARYIQLVLQCPRAALEIEGTPPELIGLLESACNY